MRQTKYVRRWPATEPELIAPDDYPYRNPLQPGLAYSALTGCLFILLVANGASLWNGFYNLPFISAYITVSTLQATPHHYLMFPRCQLAVFQIVCMP
jgi:amino acid permease